MIRQRKRYKNQNYLKILCKNRETAKFAPTLQFLCLIFQLFHHLLAFFSPCCHTKAASSAPRPVAFGPFAIRMFAGHSNYAHALTGSNPPCFRMKQTDIHLFLSGSPKSVSFLGKRSSNGAHEKTGLTPVFDSSVVCCDVVRSKGSDRLLRLACRLPPRLPSRSPSDHSLFECSQDIRITLMPSRVRIPSVLG